MTRRSHPSIRSIVAAFAAVGLIGLVAVVGPASTASAATSSISGDHSVASSYCPTISMVRSAFGASFRTSSVRTLFGGVEYSCGFSSSCPALCGGKPNAFSVGVLVDSTTAWKSTPSSPAAFFPFSIIPGTYKRLAGVSGTTTAWTDIASRGSADEVNLQALSALPAGLNNPPFQANAEYYIVTVSAGEAKPKKGLPNGSILTKEEAVLTTYLAMLNQLHPPPPAPDGQSCASICAFAVGGGLVELSWPDSGAAEYTLYLTYNGSAAGPEALDVGNNPLGDGPITRVGGQAYALLFADSSPSGTACDPVVTDLSCPVGATLSFQYSTESSTGVEGPESAPSNTATVR
jgi:hypothetical protein